MIVPNRIMKHKLVISLAPIVANANLAVDYQSVDAQHFEARGGC